MVWHWYGIALQAKLCLFTAVQEDDLKAMQHRSHVETCKAPRFWDLDDSWPIGYLQEATGMQTIHQLLKLNSTDTLAMALHRDVWGLSPTLWLRMCILQLEGILISLNPAQSPTCMSCHHLSHAKAGNTRCGYSCCIP